MARRKKSGVGGGIVAVVVGLLVLLAAIPREIWIGVGVLAAIGVGIYLYLKSKGGAQETARPARAVPCPESRAPVAPSPAVSSRVSSRLHDDEQPVAVAASPAPATPSFRIPAAPKRFGLGAWVPAGEAVELGGVSIPGGLIYVGTSLPTPRVVMIHASSIRRNLSHPVAITQSGRWATGRATRRFHLPPGAPI